MANINGWVAPPENTPGPLWAITFNLSFAAVDAHNHTPGSGLILNMDLIQFNANFACQRITNINNLTFKGVVDVQNCSVSSDGTDLWVTDGFGYEIQITSLGRLNVNTVEGAGFIGDYVPAGAEAIYTAVGDKYTFTRDGTILADVRCFDIVNFNTFNFALTNTLVSMKLTCANIINTFNPAASNTKNTVISDPMSPHNVTDGPIVLHINPATNLAQVVINNSDVYYGVFSGGQRYFDNFYTPSLRYFLAQIQVPNRTSINTQLPNMGNFFTMRPGAYRYSVASIGGMQGCIPLYLMPTTISSDQIGGQDFQMVYSEPNIQFSGTQPGFWYNGIVMSMMSFATDTTTAAPLSPFGGTA